MTIDLLVTKKKEEIRLSDWGLLVKDVETSSPVLEVDFRTVKGRNGRIPSNRQFSSKVISAAGTFVVGSLLKYEELKDRLNALLVDEDPYYITKMLPTEEDLYEFELPGEKEDDLDLLAIPHEPYHYRYKVLLTDGVNLTFLGRHSQGLLFRFIFRFVTVELPFGETIPRDITVSGSTIPYQGTALNSQLEYPWQLRLTATAVQPGPFTITIEGKTFQHTGQTPLEVGDVFLLKGIETLKNGVNINHATNYQHFEFLPTPTKKNDFSTTFVGTVEIINFVEFYK